MERHQFQLTTNKDVGTCHRFHKSNKHNFSLTKIAMNSLFIEVVESASEKVYWIGMIDISLTDAINQYCPLSEGNLSSSLQTSQPTKVDAQTKFISSFFRLFHHYRSFHFSPSHRKKRSFCSFVCFGGRYCVRDEEKNKESRRKKMYFNFRALLWKNDEIVK